jgi:hypothetical protein
MYYTNNTSLPAPSPRGKENCKALKPLGLGAGSDVLLV